MLYVDPPRGGAVIRMGQWVGTLMGILVVPLALITGCHTAMDKTQVNPSHQMILDFQAGFRATDLTVVLNGDTTLFQGTQTSDPVIGYAGTVKATVHESRIVLDVQINEQVDSVSFELDLRKGRFIGLSLIEGKLILEQWKEPFYYD